MARGWIHTVPVSGSSAGWHNKAEGEEEALGSFGTKEEAVAAGREFAQQRKTEHVIHNSDGTIAERNSYGGESDAPG
jgi:hypothetical protein